MGWIEDLKKWVLESVDAVRKLVADIYEKLKGLIEEIWTTLNNILNVLGDMLTDFDGWVRIITDPIKTYAAKLVSAAEEWLLKKITELKEIAKGWVQGALDALDSLAKKLREEILAAVKVLEEKILAAKAAIMEKVNAILERLEIIEDIITDPAKLIGWILDAISEMW